MYHTYSQHGKENLNKYAQIIKEFSKGGMDVLIHVINSETKRIDLASFFLFRQILEVSDAISELIETGCVNACKPLLRTLFECYFQLEYLFKENHDRKALQLLYHNEIKKRDYYENLAYPNKGGSYHQRLKNDRLMSGLEISEQQKKAYIENIEKINQTINHLDYVEIKNEYDSVEAEKTQRRGKSYKIKYWYELFDGPKNAEGLMIELGQTALYEFIYRDCSLYSHGEDLVHPNLEFTSESFGIKLLRDVQQLTVIGNNTILLLEKCCISFLKYQVDEPKKFSEKFLPLVLRAQELRKEM